MENIYYMRFFSDNFGGRGKIYPNRVPEFEEPSYNMILADSQ